MDILLIQSHAEYLVGVWAEALFKEGGRKEDISGGRQDRDVDAIRAAASESRTISISLWHQLQKQMMAEKEVYSKSWSSFLL